MKTNNRMSKIIRASITILLVILLFTTMTIGGFDGEIAQKNKNPVNQSFFFAQIEFTLVVGDGCACDPIENVPIVAYGLDTGHNDSNITNDDGFCVLELEIDSSYTVTIDDVNEDYHIIIFDFLVVDDQTFKFQLQEKEDSIPQNFPLLYKFLQRIDISSKPLN
ncbi:MAG: hypothetical protein JSW06_02510 [Thermoplasmatales archaeon]|nr:MAG: hypothetical protein JSW06_02510 [Thermoplasmatales archaeon]